MADLIRYTGDVLSDARDWASLSDEERRRRAFAACRDRDADELWSLTLAFLTLYGKAGSHISPHTKQAYKTGIHKLLDAWADQPLHKPSRDAAAMYVRRMEAAGLSASTIAVRLAGARMLYKALRWAGVLETDPLADARPAKDPTPDYAKRQPYSQAELERLLAVADGTDRALILLGAHAGLRVFEICKLQWEHVDLAARAIRVVEGKGRKTAVVRMSTSLADCLAALPRTDEYVLPFRYSTAARRRLRVLCAQAGVPYRAAHSLRHACGTRLQMQTGDILKTARHLRHSNVQTTAGYVHYAEAEQASLVGDW